MFSYVRALFPYSCSKQYYWKRPTSELDLFFGHLEDWDRERRTQGMISCDVSAFLKSILFRCNPAS